MAGTEVWSAEILLSGVSGLLEPHLSLTSPCHGLQGESRVNLTPSHSLIPQPHSKHFSECPATSSNSFPPPSPLLGCSGMRNVLLPSASDQREPVHLDCFHGDCLQRKFSASCTTHGTKDMWGTHPLCHALGEGFEPVPWSSWKLESLLTSPVQSMHLGLRGLSLEGMLTLPLLIHSALADDPSGSISCAQSGLSMILCVGSISLAQSRT
ncbi:PREDICTED: uncharacterized protein LOC108504885 [Lepidothrix coronata]|uniref:Uncharacterized protein LOC108504885 n=1 Tax=Lepidothrix coronata TaxID=321398 RepID=A0A6J0IGX8_9PASS|nr:PREDICTED: uncharacterized protein LOC108504885 [Lepidothrix coronata]